MNGLYRKRIVVTRAAHQADSLVDLLKGCGAIPVLYPCIAIVPPEDTRALDDALRSLARYDWLVLTSTNTVFIMAQRLQTLGIVPDWSGIKVAAVGDQTAASAKRELGIEVALLPDEYSGEGLATALPVDASSRVLLPQSAIGRTEFSEILRDRGVIVDTITAYETIIGTGGEDVPAMLQSGQIDALTFTSPSTVRNFLHRIAPLPAPVGLPVGCIGSTTAACARELGFRNVIVPDEHTLEGMLNALETAFATRAL